MQLPYEFLQKSVNKQFKDLAFFQILKRKGPYIQRSLVKIQNDLFYKHKLSGTQMKNVSFIKQIRQTLAAYQTIINEIKNDFMMTELDSLGQSIHRLFVQLISIVSFFASIILKKQKLAFNDMKDINLEELKQKQQLLKKLQQQQKLKQNLQKQKENQRMKQMEKLKYNFRQLFKMEAKNQKQNKLIESLWKTIVTQNKNNVKQCMKIKDSQLNKIIKDSCEYLYKNHSELDNIVRLTKQDIVQAQKTIQGFGDKTHLIQQNQQKVAHMKRIAQQIVNYVKERVYDKKHVCIQTNFTNVDHTKPYMTVKQLDQRRKMQLKLKNYQKTTKQRQLFIEQLQKRLNQAQQNLRIANNKLNQDEDSQSQSSEKAPANNNIRTKFNNLSRKSKHNSNSFKVNAKSSSMINKFRQASFTVGKKLSKLQKNAQNQHTFYQKFSNRSSSTSKDFTLSYHSKTQRKSQRKSQKNGIQSNFDVSSQGMSGQKQNNKKFYKYRQSNLVVEAKSNEQLSKISSRSRAETDFNKSNQNQRNDDGISIDDNHALKKGIQQGLLEQQSKQSKLKHTQVLQIVQSFKLLIRPFRFKRYLQSTYKHPSLLDPKQSQQLKESRLLKSSKLKKSSSQHQISRYFFEPLDNIDRSGPLTAYKEHAKLIQIQKRKIMSHYASLERQKLKDNDARDLLKNKKNSQNIADALQLNTISIVKLKNNKQRKQQSGKQNQSILKGCIKTASHSKRQSKKQISTLLKKSCKKKTITFDVLPNQRQKTRKSFHHLGSNNLVMNRFSQTDNSSAINLDLKKQISSKVIKFDKNIGIEDGVNQITIKSPVKVKFTNISQKKGNEIIKQENQV